MIFQSVIPLCRFTSLPSVFLCKTCTMWKWINKYPCFTFSCHEPTHREVVSCAKNYSHATITSQTTSILASFQMFSLHIVLFWSLQNTVLFPVYVMDQLVIHTDHMTILSNCNWSSDSFKTKHLGHLSYKLVIYIFPRNLVLLFHLQTWMIWPWTWPWMCVCYWTGRQRKATTITADHQQVTKWSIDCLKLVIQYHTY